MTNSSPVPLAIVGIGCRLPGDATTPEKLWDLLARGESAWTPVPSDRWNDEAFRHPNGDDRNGTHNHRGGHFLRQDVGVFDAAFFGLNPQEATAMDPQQRLLLETTYEALESAGIPLEHIRGSNTSVHMAMFTRDYDRNIYKDMMSIPKYHVTGTGEAILANRISHLFDLHGPSMTLDTGCSGGMTAVYQACQGLRSGATDLALAGAANLILSPDHMISMSNLHMLSAEGKSYSFDRRGAGYGRGEGIATLVIKRLDDALRARDPIRAVLREAVINQDGHTNGITLPSGPAQAALEKRAWSNIGLHPREAGYVEAHGTGTAAGDKAELEGISEVFCQNRDTPLIVGSIKPNIGHLESVSGLAALIKAAMILEHNAIPPNVNFEQPKEGLDLAQKRIQVPQTLETWTCAGTPRISVNSFGYGGTNAHAILERAPRPHGDHPAIQQPLPRLFVFSAKSQSSLLKTLNNTQLWASENANQTALRDLRHTLATRRSLMQWRFSCVASNTQELVEALAKGSKADAMTRAQANNKVNFVFTGQGAQWAGMGRELLTTPAFADSIKQSSRILLDFGASWELVEELLRPNDSSRLRDAELAQPATTAVQIALVDLARSVGIVPDAVIGHSSGEVAAAYAAGFVSQHTALKAAFFRGFSAGIAKRKGCGKGGMLAVGLGEHDVAPYLSKLKLGRAVVACQNSPSSTTVSGDDAAITELSDALRADSVFNRRLQVDTAYHSHHMQAAAPEYMSALGQVPVDASPKAVKFFSSVTGRQESNGFGPKYWTANLVSRVRFCDALQQLCQGIGQDQSHQIFVEIGPHAALAGPARQCIAELPMQIPYEYHSALVRGTDALQSALLMMGKLLDRGLSLDREAVSALDRENADAVVLPTLPTYAWDHSKRHWHQSRVSRDYLMRKNPYHDLLGTRMTENSPLRPVWRHLVGIDGLPWLADHVVDGLVIFPGSGYLCMAITALSQLVAERHSQKQVESFVLKDVHFLKGLVIPEAPERVEMQLSFQPVGDDRTSLQFQFSIATLKEGEQWAEHCKGLVIADFAESQYGSLGSAAVENLVEAIDPTKARVVTSKELYSQLESAGNYYGPMFTGIDQFAFEGSRAISNVTIPDVASVMPAQHVQPHLIHPTTLDILLHSSLPLVHAQLSKGSVMPVHINELTLSPTLESAAGSKLTAATSLTSAEFRTAEADLLIFAGSETCHGPPVMAVSTMELRNLGANASSSSSESATRDLCYDVKWNLDADFLTSHHLEVRSDLPSPQARLKIMDMATGIYIRRCIEEIRTNGLNIPEEYHKLLFRWMMSTEMNSGIVDAQHDDEVLKLVPEQGVEGEFLYRLGPALPYIVTGKTNALQLMLEEDLLYRVYADDSSARCYSLMSQYLQHKSFKQSDLSVVEIGGGTGGATLPFLQALNENGTRPASYDFTDVSAGFFEKARSKLQGWADAVNYRPLDIEKEPELQGFQPHSYDVVLACNVLHATASITDTLSKVRSLLKPDGVLLLIEVTNPQRYLNITFGTLPGWWKGAPEGRNTGPFLSADGWSKAMSRSSLAMQVASQDDPESPVSSFMVARAVDMPGARNPFRVRLIAPPNLPKGLSTFASQLATKLRSQNCVAYRSVWADDMPHENIVNVIIDNGAKPTLEHVTREKFRHISGLLKKPAKVVWVTAQDHDNDGSDPRKHLITGLSRTAHAENENLQMVTVDVQQGLRDRINSNLTSHLVRMIQSTMYNPKVVEREFVYDGKDMNVPRVLPSEALNKWISRESEEPTMEPTTFSDVNRPLKLDTRSKDFRNKPVFIDDVAHKSALAPEEIEIEAKSYGMPHRSSKGSINEYAGIIAAVGSSVKDLRIGDRVVALSPTMLASRPRAHHSCVQRLPDFIPFNIAAALPIPMMTVIYALQMQADIQPGQTLLIDGATDTYGQAAVVIARHLGATVIASASTHEEAKFLADQLQLPSSCIVPRKGYLCKRIMRGIASNKGLDAIVSCSGAQLPCEISQALKSFGTIVQIGDSAHINVLSAHDGSSSPSITISSFDLEILMETRSELSCELLAESISFLGQHVNMASCGISVRSLAELDESLRSIQQVDVRKTVLDLESHTLVNASEPGHGDLALPSDATYVVSGGLGDLGKRYLRIMAKAGARSLVTLSRSGSKSAEYGALQKELHELQPGCTLTSIKCNIVNIADVRTALTEIRDLGLPPIKGVVQAAVVLNDSTLDSMTASVFNSVLETKLDGTINLNKVFSTEELDFFISLSSAVGVIGTSGQANYNAGNTVQDALAQFNKGSSCHYMALNIGTIDGADATVGNQARVQALARQGLVPIMPEEVEAFFEYSMSPAARTSGCHQAVIGFTADSLAQTTAANGSAHTRMFTHVRETARTENFVDEVSEQKTFRDLVTEGCHPDDVAEFVAESVQTKLAHLIGMDASEIDPCSSITDLGLDSLVAIELRNWIMREFDAPIQSSEIMDNQSLLALAKKIAQRSRLDIGDSGDARTTTSAKTGNSKTSSRSSSSNRSKVSHSSSASTATSASTASSRTELDDLSTQPSSQSPLEDRLQTLPEPILKGLQMPDLDQTLDILITSNSAICSPDEINQAFQAAQEFKPLGRGLKKTLEEDLAAPDMRKAAYEKTIYLERREPLQDHATFFMGHSPDEVPSHSQAERAAIITLSALSWKSKLEEGSVEAITSDGTPFCPETMEWLFHSSQEPRKGLDQMQKFPSSRKVVAMCNGHFFQVDVAGNDSLTALVSIYTKIIELSEQPAAPVAVLTSYNRDTWAELRSDLMEVSSNVSVIEAIDSAAFVVCLDDSDPDDPTGRCTSILLNDCHLTNRWLDKTLWFTVAANGVSALVAENTMLDHLSCAQLHQHVSSELLGYSRNYLNTLLKQQGPIASQIRELIIKIPTAIGKWIAAKTAENVADYEPIHATRREYQELNQAATDEKKLESKGVVAIATMLATRLFYGRFEPAWEGQSIAAFAKGRVDWTQNMTPTAAAWIEDALAYMNGGSSADLLVPLRRAAKHHSEMIQCVQAGQGYVEPLYALRAAALAEQERKADGPIELPALFDTTLWKMVDRRATPKRVVTEYLAGEGGCLLRAHHSLYLRHEMQGPVPRILVQGRMKDVARFESCLDRAMALMRAVME